MNLSIIIPVFNEEENLEELYKKILDVVKTNSGQNYEIIFVDDGSTDNSFFVLKKICEKNTKILRLSRNYGQSIAIGCGLDHSNGDYIVFMDADGQNDPNDIPKLIQKLNEGYDVVSGWRKNRKDPFLRTIVSKLANKIISAVTGVKLHDYGCTLKIYKKEYLQNLSIYGEIHRFLPAYAVWLGAKITEIPVNHHPRIKGKSKYGFGRTFKVILDLITAKFFLHHLTKPSHLFGGIGVVLFIIAVILGIYVLYEKYFLNVWAHRNPLLLLAVFLGSIGIQFIVLGLLAELIVRIFYSYQKPPIYIVKEKINT